MTGDDQQPAKRAARLLSVFAAAEDCSLSESTIRRLAASGELRSVRVGNRLLFRPEDLDAFISERVS